MQGLIFFCLFFLICAPARALPKQSPIALNSSNVWFTPGYLNANYKRSAGILSNGGQAEPHFLKVDFLDGGELVTSNKGTFYLQNVHIHILSEHAFNGRKYNMEVHLVHKNSNGNLAVVGLLYERSTRAFTDPFFSQLEIYLPKLVNGTTSIPINAISPSALNVPADSYFTYDGSLTTPPFSEGVLWYVHSQIRYISFFQFAKLADALKGRNSRELQPLNGRTIEFIQLVTAVNNDGLSSF